jgi:hypothetical protein
MWTISSTDVQQAKERIDRCRAELEARYADEKQALDAESAELETLERAAGEFAQRRSGTGFSPAAAPSLAALAQSEGEDNAAERTPSSDDPTAPAEEIAPAPASAPAGEIDPDDYDEANLSLDILKPGSRWRLNRAARLLNPESGSGPT